MALLNASTIECRPGAGSDTNGGGASNSAGTNLSLQNSAAYASTDVVADGSTTLTSATANWGTDVVENWIYLQGGTGSLAAVRRRITARPDASTLTVDATVAAGTGITGNVGGALATTGEVGKALTSAAGGLTGMVGHVKSGTDTLTSTTANVSGGRLDFTQNDQAVCGYNTTRGDLSESIGSANRPVIDCAALTSFIVVGNSSGGARCQILNLKVDGKGNSTVTGFGNGTSYVTHNCTAANCTTGFQSGKHTLSSATVCGTGFTSVQALYGTFTNDCTTSGLSFSNGAFVVNHVSINDAIAVNVAAAAPTHIIGSTIHEASGDGVSGVGTSGTILNTLFTQNTGDAIDFSSTTSGPLTYFGIHNAFYSNGSVYEATPLSSNTIGAITLTGDPYTAEASDDLSPNSTSGAGASLRNAGLDVFGQTDNRDVGAVQHADPAGGSGGNPHLTRGLAF